MDPIQRYRGCLMGLAAGDALGTTLEFRPPGTFAPLQDMVGGGPFGLEAGQWTDDTSLALCLATSLVTMQAYDPADQMARFRRWYREGYLSSTGACFDIGNTTAAAIRRYEQSGEPYSGSTHPRSAGNGSLMRLAPVPLAFASDPSRAVALAGDSSRTTHGAAAAVDACRYFAGLIVGALQDVDKATLLAPHYTPVPGMWSELSLEPAVAEVAAGSFHHREPPVIQGTGYVVRSLEAALWAFARSSDFRAGCLMAANLGDDADTTAAIYGQIAGAYYGIDDIPSGWRQRIAQAKRITALADGLLALADAGAATRRPTSS